MTSTKPKFVKGGIGSHERPIGGATNDWLTPAHVIAALGPFDLDPCASETAPARCAAAYYTWRENGLAQPWWGFVWCNPPYSSHVGAWIGRVLQHGNALLLVFARTETPPMSAALQGCDGVLFLRKRLTFLRASGGGVSGNAGGPSMILAFGALACERIERAISSGALDGVWMQSARRTEQPSLFTGGTA